ncbi:MAG: hypothetical protein A3H72_00535 [Candidatus Doudnabacteria bacterium RIFCSPLOWO2_02_FULL_48_8]|uniref:TrpR like protein, YerC/YecD n=1 Tax=Candidatus Doudnabacteria bacterium RIFCSPHIGHO2_01_FULL_46_24 TaxID=1817825 RepID=A0A1F5NU95_9BACT|nr:MAG: hypothetical protein A2720_01490 [Candidatus Doudnabacteria bacterium RIFCSPHIGHO2_01_FULL_46_24]OGE95578.1 MAG: hypothetical protein A3H72_00535 [Candidatus Doudnabacteria bacterium RIFCSPLOWO2_02_FULL_48_8]OGE95799.1 MAG: hypothetical protein A3E98_02225 [Candidatus Doudnabacteria bacterium RIFCSPHIGHO2_12_FULL_48_11]
MAKFSLKAKLSYKDTQEMIMSLCTAIAAIQNTREAAQLLTDLLGKQEMEMLAKRLKIAELLLNGETYQNIREALKVSEPTIARVNHWTQQSGEGYRLVLERTRQKRKNLGEAEKPVRLSALKRKYPMYFWPQIMLEHWAKSSSQKEKRQMKEILEKLGAKRKLYSELDKLLASNYNT